MPIIVGGSDVLHLVYHPKGENLVDQERGTGILPLPAPQDGETAMRVEFADPRLDRLYTDLDYEDHGYTPQAVRGFRKVMQFIYAAKDERDLRAMNSLRFEKLKGTRKGEYSLRLNKQWRLIVTVKKDEPGNTILVIEIVDYH